MLYVSPGYVSLLSKFIGHPSPRYLLFMFFCMFYLGPFTIKGVKYIQCDMILTTWTKARTWKSYDCYFARDSVQDDL